MVSPLEIAEDSIALLEKAAREADALEAQVRDLTRINQKLEQELGSVKKQASAAPKFDRRLLLKIATTLEDEGLLAPGMEAEKLASLYEQDPNRVADIALRLLYPMSADGKPIKAATEKSPGAPNLVRFEGREVVDHDGWLSALK